MASGKKRTSPILWMGLGCAMVVFCAIVIGGGALVFGSQGGTILPFNLPGVQSNQPGKPEATLQILRDANPTEIITPLIIPTEGAPPQAVGKLITVEQLPKLVLAANEIPSGWTSEKGPGITNEESGKPELYNDSGRLTDILYLYTAPGDPCKIMNGPTWLIVWINLFEQADGARMFYEGYTDLGKDLGIGEQSVYSITPNWYLDCGSNSTYYSLKFERLNTFVTIDLDALKGAMSDDEAEKQILVYARIVDGKISANAK